MRPRQGVVIAILVALVGFIAPLCISLQLAWNESVANERDQGLGYAREVLRRSEETAQQFYIAIQRLNQDHLPHCSAEEIDLMRQISIASSYIEMVGRISGNTLECTSLGTTTPISLGEPTLITANGVSERMNIELWSINSERLDLVSRDGVAVLVNTGALIDEQTEGTDVGLALTVPSSVSHERLIESGQTFRPAWFKPVARGASTSYIDDGYIVSQVRSRGLDLAALSVMPERYAYRHVRHFALIYVPIGILCGCGLSWAVLYLSRARSSIPALLKAAARSRDFFVEYQPIVDLRNGRCVGAEALVRWRRHDTVMSPASFIPLAEESGVIGHITKNVLEIVARDLPRLLAIDPKFHISINLSASDLKTLETLKGLQALLARSGASPHNVLIETTEHSLIHGEQNRNTIAAVRSAGFQIAIDDFGTGYSNLSCLQTLNLDVLKIDKTFVDTIGPGSPMVSHIIDIGQSLQMRIVAEGVEKEQQAEFLRSRGVDYAQGWLYGKPMGVDILSNRLRASHQENAELSGDCIVPAEKN